MFVGQRWLLCMDPPNLFPSLRSKFDLAQNYQLKGLADPFNLHLEMFRIFCPFFVAYQFQCHVKYISMLRLITLFI